MSERLVVNEYNERLDFHVCTKEDGTKVYLDLLTSSSFPEDTNPKDLVGKTVFVGWTHPWISLAEEVSIVSA